jgi:UDP-N-acetylmuramoylalanine--D-glutamate ligase
MLDGRNILVVGMGRSGVSAARYALDQGAQVTVTDGRTDAPRIEGAQHTYGTHNRADFLGADLIVLSPGVPANAPDVRAAIDSGVAVVSELGFAAERVQDRGIPILAITGTNGKSSVTWYTSQLLEAAGLRVFVGGNFGTPLTDLLRSDESPDIAVVEVSSYQLERPGGLSPLAAVCLNLAPDHLARHGTLQNYAEHKLRIFEGMTAAGQAAIPSAVENNPDGLLSHGSTKAKRLWLDRHPGVVRDGNTVQLNGTNDDGPVDLSDLSLLGEHNRDNAAAAILLSVAAGLTRAQLDLRKLTALPHRLEPVHSKHGVTWVNDSKATNIDAALVGIGGIEGSKIVLLGGAGKAGSDYDRLRPALAENTRKIICFGDAGPAIADAIAGKTVQRVPTLSDAVVAASQAAQPNDIVLLSPACASFDEFSNFEERGRAFASLAKEANP